MRNSSTDFAQIPLSVLSDPRLTRHDIKVYGALRYKQNKTTGQCNPSRQTIADIAGVSVYEVDRAKRRLSKFGLLKVISKPGRTRSNHYIFKDDTVVTNFDIKGDTAVAEKVTGMSPNNKRDKKNNNPPIVPPTWLDPEAWSDFIDHRKELKKPVSNKAQQLLIKKLTELRSQGMNPVEVIEQSIANGWAGLFPINRQCNETNAKIRSARRQPSVFDVIETVSERSIDTNDS